MTQDGNLILCRRANSYCLKRWDRKGTPVMSESANEIDQLMQKFMSESGRYDLSVFNFTPEQEQELVIRKLRNY